MLQNVKATAFTVCELLRENQQGELSPLLTRTQIRVNRSFENMFTHALLTFLFLSHVFIRTFEIFLFCFMGEKKYSSKSMLLNFSVNTIFFTDEKHTEYNLDTKIKVFHESISCFKKYF